MFKFKKVLLVSLVLSLSSVSTQLWAVDAVTSTSAKEGSLKLVMQGLSLDTEKLLEAILTEDFPLIESYAEKIADHDKPSMEIRKKLMKAMGVKMAKFKANDDVVHHAAVDIVNDAKNKDMTAIGKNFQVMIGGCLACHGEFKAEVSEILK